ncbi:hypothetical protein SCUP234_10913 [Seiridium cupressi]
MKFLNILVLAASVSAFSLDPRHHQSKNAKGNKAAKASKANNTARAIEAVTPETRALPVSVDIENRNVVEVRHHQSKNSKASKASKANKNGNAAANATARAVESSEDEKRALPVEIDARDTVAARHHQSKNSKASKASKASKNGNAAANATARAVDTLEDEKRSMPVPLDLEGRDVEARHHQSKNAKGNKASKASKNGNAAANATARAVDTEGKAPVDLVGRAFVA